MSNWNPRKKRKNRAKEIFEEIVAKKSFQKVIKEQVKELETERKKPKNIERPRHTILKLLKTKE